MKYRKKTIIYIPQVILLFFFTTLFISQDLLYSKTILDLQTVKTKETKVLKNKTKVELINLNPNIGIWYLYRYHKPSQSSNIFYHLELPYPNMSISLNQEDPESIIIKNKTGFLCL